SLLNQQGSQVVFGDLLVVPVDEGFLYVQPLFVESNQGGTVIPELKRVVVVHGQTVTIANSLDETLSTSFGTPTQPPPGGGGGVMVQQLLNQAVRDFTQAEQLLRQGDLAGYQKAIEDAQAAIQKAADLEKQQGGGSSGSSVPTSPPPSPSPSPPG